jgi:hypothetical protein
MCEDMLEFLSASENLPFTVALGVVAGLAAIETLGLLVGFAFSSSLDSALGVDVDPGVDVDVDLDVGADVDAGGDAAGCHPLSVLGFGKVPTFIVLLLLTSLFGIGGLLVQGVSQQAMGSLLNPWLASLLALTVALPLVGVSSRLLAHLMLRDETQAVSEDTFVGKTATITLGKSARGHAAQARLVDEFGQTHYVLVEPLRADDQYLAGDEVLLVERNQNIFFAVENSISGLDALSEPPLLDTTENQNATG